MIFFGGFAGVFSQQGIVIGPVQIATICAIWGVVISAVFGLRAYRRLFMGPLVGFSGGKKADRSDNLRSDSADIIDCRPVGDWVCSRPVNSVPHPNS